MQVLRRGDPGRFAAVGGGGHGQVVQTPVHAHEPDRVEEFGVVSLGGVQVRGLDVQADEPATRPPRDRGEQDPAVLPRLLDAAKKHCPGIAKVWADKGYTGPATRQLAAKTGIDIEIVTGPKPPPGSGFLVQPRRRVVERTHAWINRNRRMARQWEATLEAHTGFLILSQIAVLLNRLT
ncbi:MAG: transposase [Candidatus Nanopelagicales bacterium]